MAAYYNDNDKFVCAWLRELIKAGLIADGEVDERPIQEVSADDIRGFTQCHFFAGIGGWSYALRLAGWPDNRSVWTGSCPCQGYSAAGKQKGAADPRNLWPTWFRLIRECKPLRIFGEQVENAVGHGWLDAVSTDLEAEDYAIGSAVLGAHSVGAPHIRQRLWFVAESKCKRTNGNARTMGQTQSETKDCESESWGPSVPTEYGGNVGKLADDDRSRCGTRGAGEAGDGRDAARIELAGLRDAGELGNSSLTRPQGRIVSGNGADQWPVRSSSVADRLDDSAGDRREGWRLKEHADIEGTQGLQLDRPGTRGFWDGAEWIFCQDGKCRPTEPGVKPLAHGLPGRVGRLRGYSNAIVPQVAAAFISAYMQIQG